MEGIGLVRELPISDEVTAFVPIREKTNDEEE